MIDFEKDRLMQSPHLVVRVHQNGFLAHHSLYGYPTVLNEPSVEVLNIFRQPMSTKDVRLQYDIENLNHWLCYFFERHFLITEHCDERAEVKETVESAVNEIARGRRLESLGLVLDEECNFDCSYCLSKKLIRASGRNVAGLRRMSWSVAQRAIDCFVAFARRKRKKKLEVYFGGSEPLLNWEVMRRTILYCLQRYGDNFNFTFSTNTNASLITRERAEFFRQHEITVATSLDGLKTVNDAVRRLNTGRGTFNKILAGWDNLTSVGRKVEWFCLTLTDENIGDIDEKFFDFIAARGISSCSFEPDIIYPMRRPPEEVVEALLNFKRLGTKYGITVGGMWDKPLNNMFEPNLRKRIFDCSAFTGRGISILPSGDVLLCSYSATKIGNIDNLAEVLRSDRFRKFITSRAIGNIEACRGCVIEGQCIGGCCITSEYGHHTGSMEAFYYRCELYRRATQILLDDTVKNDSI